MGNGVGIAGISNQPLYQIIFSIAALNSNGASALSHRLTLERYRIHTTIQLLKLKKTRTIY